MISQETKDMIEAGAAALCLESSEAAYVAAERIRFEAWREKVRHQDSNGWTDFDIWLAAKEDNSPLPPKQTHLEKYGHEVHCNLMFPATLNTDDDHCSCGASKK